MIKGLTSGSSGFNGDRQIFANFFLADEFSQPTGPKLKLYRCVVIHGGAGDDAIRIQLVFGRSHGEAIIRRCWLLADQRQKQSPRLCPSSRAEARSLGMTLDFVRKFSVPISGAEIRSLRLAAE